MNNLPPGPRLPPTLQLARWIVGPTRFLDDCHRRFGDVFTLRLPGIATSDFVVFCEPSAVRSIFTASNEIMSAGPANEIVRPFVGSESILVASGAKHTRMRRIVMPPFHGKRMSTYAQTMQQVTARVVARWPRGRAFPIHKEMQKITLEVIIRTMLGFNRGALFRDVHDLMSRGVDEAVRPGLLMPSLQIDLGRWSAWGRFIRIRARTDALIQREIERRRREGIGDRDDMLSLLVEARDEDGSRLTDIALRDQMRTLLVAGHETTATTLAWFFELASRHPHAWRILVDEIRDHVGRDPVTAEHIPKLVYLDAALKEALRLRPVIPLIGRVVLVDHEIAGHRLPIGTMVSPAVYLTHRRPETYPDPTAFRPERWLGQRIDPYAFFPFGGGRRRCIGMAFSLYEMKVIVAETLSTVELQPASRRRSRVIRRGLTLAPSRGVPMVARDVT